MTSLHADEAFLAHYQFSHDPFAPRVPGFKFFPAQRKPVLGQLHHLARYSQLLLAVVGPEGSGKTLLRQALVASTNKQAVQSVVVAQGVTGSEALLRQVAQGLSIAQADVRSILAQVGQLARRCNSKCRNILKQTNFRNYRTGSCCVCSRNCIRTDCCEDYEFILERKNKSNDWGCRCFSCSNGSTRSASRRTKRRSI